MAADITLLDLSLRRRVTIGYGMGIAAYALIVVVLFPSFKNDTSLNQLTASGSPVAALLGAVGSLTSPPGWLNANLYANFVPLIELLATIGYGASCIAGQDEDRTLALLTTLPVRRQTIIIDKFTALLAQALVVPIATAFCVLGGRGFDLTLATGPLLGVTAGVTLLGLFFGRMALLIGAATGSRGLALGITSTAAAISYLISSLAPVIHWLHPARYISPFFYAVGDNQLQQGLPLTWAGVLAAATLTFAITTVITFNRLDVH